MIKERVGMRVKTTDESVPRYNIGDTGTIIHVDGDDIPRVRFDNGEEHYVSTSFLTEIKEGGMYLDEALKVVREDENMEMSWDFKKNWYSFNEFFDMSVRCEKLDDRMQKNNYSVRVREIPIKEVTLADIEEKYGCKVKVVK